MVRLLAVAALTAAVAAASAEDKKAPAASDTWTREAGDFEIAIAFAKKDLTMTIMNGTNGIVITNSYTIDKEGLVKLKITKVEEKGSFPAKPPVGLEASFVWKPDGKKAKLSDLSGQGTEEGKTIFEGEYQEKMKD